MQASLRFRSPNMLHHVWGFEQPVVLCRRTAQNVAKDAESPWPDCQAYAPKLLRLKCNPSTPMPPRHKWLAKVRYVLPAVHAHPMLSLSSLHLAQDCSKAMPVRLSLSDQPCFLWLAPSCLSCHSRVTRVA